MTSYDTYYECLFPMQSLQMIPAIGYYMVIIVIYKYIYILSYGYYGLFEKKRDVCCLGFDLSSCGAFTYNVTAFMSVYKD